MSMDIEEQLELRAPVERVWRFLIDPEQVVTCLPGAELTKVEDPRSFLGQMKVKVGPVTVAYTGRVKLLEVDDAMHVVRMSGEGTEKGGAGSAKMTMESSVVESAAGSLVVVKSKVDVAGKIVQFGRGMVKSVAGQMFKQFGANLRAALETDDTAAAAGTASAAGAASAAAGSGTGSGSAAAPASAPAPGSAPAPAPGSSPAGATGGAPMPSVDDTVPLSMKAASSEKPTAPLVVRRPAAEPVHILPMILKALFEPIARFLRRLFGRR